MKHLALCGALAVLLAALLAGCGAETATPASDAAPASVSTAASAPEDRPAQKKARGRRAAHRTACGRTSSPAGKLGAAGANRVDGSHGGDAG